MNRPSGNNPPGTRNSSFNRLSAGLWAALMILTLAVFGLVVLTITLYLRADIRDRIVSRDGEIFTAVAQMLLEDTAGEAALEFSDIFPVVLQTSRMQGVVAVRVYDDEGNFLDSVPLEVEASPFPEDALEPILNLVPASSFEADGDLSEIFLFYPDEDSVPRTPLLHVAIPIHRAGSERLDAIAYYTIDGRHIAAEFRALDRNLAIQAGIAFASGSLIFILAAGIAFRRLDHANRLLHRRTQSLLKANQELALAAKSSAVGAVSAHLIHGLKSPLAGLNDFVKSTNAGGADSNPDDWQAARETTERMQNLIESVAGILREEHRSAAYEVTLEELLSLVQARMMPGFDSIEVEYDLRGKPKEETFISSRDANLITLILVNLLENAIKVTPEGEYVTLTVSQNHESFVFEVRDRGDGIAEHVRERLFQPGVNGFREGSGSGLGLAISHQLAQHLEATLELVDTGPKGSLFRLTW